MIPYDTLNQMVPTSLFNFLNFLLQSRPTDMTELSQYSFSMSKFDFELTN